MIPGRSIATLATTQVTRTTSTYLLSALPRLPSPPSSPSSPSPPLPPSQNKSSSQVKPTQVKPSQVKPSQVGPLPPHAAEPPLTPRAALHPAPCTQPRARTCPTRVRATDGGGGGGSDAPTLPEMRPRSEMRPEGAIFLPERGGRLDELQPCISTSGHRVISWVTPFCP